MSTPLPPRKTDNESDAVRAAPSRSRFDWVHPVGVAALALSQPVYSLIAANPQFLAAHGVGGRGIALLVASLSVLIPAMFLLPELLAAPAGRRARQLARAATLGFLAALFALQVAIRAHWGGGPIVVVACAAVGAAFAIAYDRRSGARTFTSLLAVAAIVSPLTFLFDPRIREFWRRSDDRVLATHIANPVPVVVVILDELPLVALLDEHGEIDAQLFPNIARLATTSHWFRNATTTGSYTDLAVPSIHSGRYPSDREVPPTLENYPGNLFTLLGGTYRTWALETTTDLQPRSVRAQGPASGERRGDPRLLLLDVAAIGLHVVTPRPWSERLPPLNAGWADFWGDRAAGDGTSGARADDRLAQVRAFVGGLEASERPTFVYLHPMLPHYPWEYLPSGRGYFEPRVVPGLVSAETWDDDSFAVRLAYQRLLLQTQAIDRVLGELFDRLERLGWFDPGLVMLMADHGAVFTEGLSRRDLRSVHDEAMLAEIMAVPLLIKLPHQHDGAIHEESVELVDVLPTLADVLQVAIPWQVDGCSLLSPCPGARTTRRVQLRVQFLKMTFDHARRAPLAALARERAGWFGRAPDGNRDLYRIGPHPELIGLPANPTEAPDPHHTAVVRNEPLLTIADLEQTRLPAMILGEIRSDSAAEPLLGQPFAISVNGTIRATTLPHHDPDGSTSFAAIVPEDAFKLGANRVEVFRIEDEHRLVEVPTTGLETLLRERFEQSRRELLRADSRSGWDGFTGSLGTTARRDGSGALVVEAPGGAPLLDVPTFDAAGAAAFIVEMETESKAQLDPRLRFMTADDPNFTPSHFLQSRVRAGEGSAYFEVRAPRLMGRLRVDLGRVRSPIVLRSFSVRAVD